MLEFDNSTVGEEESFKLRHVWEALTDWQVWLLSLVNMSVITPGMRYLPARRTLYSQVAVLVYGISLFLPYVAINNTL